MSTLGGFWSGVKGSRLQHYVVEIPMCSFVYLACKEVWGTDLTGPNKAKRCKTCAKAWKNDVKLGIVKER